MSATAAAPAAPSAAVPGGNTTLVGCVGYNPASVLITARHSRPSRAILVGTVETAPLLQTVSAQLALPTRCIVLDSANEPLNDIANRVLEQLLVQPGDKVLFDVTGGNKLMTIGAWAGIDRAGLASDAVQLRYLTANGQLVDPVRGAVLPQRTTIEIAEVLAWQGAGVQSAKWSGSPDNPPADSLGRRALGEALLQALAGKRLKINPDRNVATVRVPQPLRSHLPPGFSQRGMRLESEVDGYLQHNGWLEELCLLHACTVLGGDALTRAALGAQLIRSSHGTDEADVVLVRGARVCVIEAKARRTAEGAGADLQKRIAKTREFFGSHAHVIFVHPAWGTCPPRTLLGDSVRNAHLVGSDLQALDAAVASALAVA